MRELRSIEVVSGVNESGEAFVTVAATDDKRAMMLGQLPPDELRGLAHSFLAAAEAAETDAIVFRLLRDKFELPYEIIGQFVSDMRNMRES